MNLTKSIFGMIYIFSIMLIFVGIHNIDNGWNASRLHMCDWNLAFTECMKPAKIYATGILETSIGSFILMITSASLIFGEISCKN